MAEARAFGGEEAAAEPAGDAAGAGPAEAPLPGTASGVPPPPQHRLLNQFLYNDRFMQTSYNRRRNKETATEPPTTTNATGESTNVSF